MVQSKKNLPSGKKQSSDPSDSEKKAQPRSSESIRSPSSKTAETPQSKNKPGNVIRREAASRK